ncbi:MAG: radical SAM protein [Deltaproteobacteria bacterium]|nr:radical SAM protein [Deltaproteobacteria bacterium]
MLRVSEIFASLQGESTFAGLPCAFIRLAGCNLACRYCDTGYAGNALAGMSLSLDEIVERVMAFGLDLVEVTGGEPLLQTESLALIRLLLNKGLTVLVETNGSQDIGAVDARAHLIIDVKTPGSGMAGSFLEKNLAALRKHHQLKFVVCDEEDFFWSVAFIENNLPVGTEILFSPVTITLPAPRLAELMLERRVKARLQLQLHKIIWPTDERGR